MTRITLRCEEHRYAIFDTETNILEIHCRRHSKRQGEPVYHHWRISEGSIAGVDCDDATELEELDQAEQHEVSGGIS